MLYECLLISDTNIGTLEIDLCPRKSHQNEEGGLGNPKISPVRY